jgi:hypothetical protein
MCYHINLSFKDSRLLQNPEPADLGWTDPINNRCGGLNMFHNFDISIPRSKFLILPIIGALILSLGVASPASAAQVTIDSSTSIEDSDSNPNIRISHFSLDDWVASEELSLDDFTIDLTDTGLTAVGVTRISNSVVDIVTSGIAHRGNIKITASASAFSGTDGSNELGLFISSKTLPECSNISDSPTEPCVQSGTAKDSSDTDRDFQVNRSNNSLVSGSYAEFKFSIEDSNGDFVTLSAGDSFSDVEILYPATGEIGEDFNEASFALTSAENFEFTKSLETISGSDFVKWTVSLKARTTTLKTNCGLEGEGPILSANAVCGTEDGTYNNLISDTFDIWSPDRIPEFLTSGADGGYLAYVGQSFSWARTPTEPFRFQLTGPSFRPVDRTLGEQTSPAVESNSGALKMFLPTAMATELYGADFDPALTRKDNIDGTVVDQSLGDSDGLSITQPAGGYLFELASHPFSAPVFAISNTSVESESSVPAPVFRPYYGPIVRPFMEVDVEAGTEAQISGFRLSTVQKVTVGDQELTVTPIDNSNISISIPQNLAGKTSLVLHWTNEGDSGAYRVIDALNITPVLEPEDMDPATVGTVNAGSFKGYVAIYAKGYEGKRLSAKVGTDWVIVDPIVNNQENGSLHRSTDFTGAGVDISVRIFIDRVLIKTVELTTK